MIRVLVFSPHPDDEAIGCGGTLRQHSLAGAEVRVIFLTSGEHGSRAMTPEQTRRVREKEAAAAATVLGIRSMQFWHSPDGALRSSAKLVSKTVGEISDFRPDFVYTTHASEAHGDHRAAARLVLRALATLKEPWPVLRLFEVWTPLQKFDVLEDISGHVEAKRRAIQCYASQCANQPFDEASTALNRYRGLMHNTGNGGYAEAFLQVSFHSTRQREGTAQVHSQALEPAGTTGKHAAEQGVCKT